MGILQYTQDHDETYPERINLIGNWKQALDPYVKSKAVYQCPSNPRNDVPDFDGDGYNVSYSSNRGVVSPSGRSNGPFVDAPYSVGLADIPAPSSVIGIMDTTIRFSDFRVDVPIDDAQKVTDSVTPWGSLFAGHMGFANFLFLDGHVKSMRPLGTLDQSDGGSGTINLWTVNNTNFTSGTPAAPVESDASGFTVLNFAQNLYK